MNCAEIKKLFSSCVDGRVNGIEMRGVMRHVEQCRSCAREYAEMQHTQQLLASLGRRRAPADLALKLRLAISREAAQARRPRFEGVLVRLENALNAFMVPVTAGGGRAGFFFGPLAGFFCFPASTAAERSPAACM